MTDEEICNVEDFTPYFESGKVVRGKYYTWATGKPLPVILEPDLREKYPDDAAVNGALRRLAELEEKISATES